MKKIIRLVVICGIVFTSSLSISTLSAYAEGGTAPIYLTQEPVSAEESADTPQEVKSPQTYDEGILAFAILLAVSVAGLIGSIYVVKNNKKDSNER